MKGREAGPDALPAMASLSLAAAQADALTRLLQTIVDAPSLPDFAPARIDDVASLYRKREKDGAKRWDTQGPWIAQSDDFHVQPPAGA